ncbi:hypothetical protein TrST_g6267 [Triparma strigata]|uniref:RNI-like protein n=1 Tax=Triparma strigata TaxID=1606541 RepID=A0A9W7EYA1_9STRA|nr:hypothetical protein TrST_g6267 [Triparma strigata]
MSDADSTDPLPTTLKVSSSTVNLSNISKTAAKVWRQPHSNSFDPDPVESCLVDLHAYHGSLDGEYLEGIHWSDCDGSMFDSSHVLSLAPISTHLKTLSLMNCSVPTTSLSPVLIASLGHATLKNLNLELTCDNIDGLVGTVAACCPSLETLCLLNSSTSEWWVSESDVNLLAHSALNLRVLHLSGINFSTFDYDDDSESKSSPEPTFKLKGLNLQCNNLTTSILRTLTTSKLTQFSLTNPPDSSNPPPSTLLRILGSLSPPLLALSLIDVPLLSPDVKSIFTYFPELRRLSIGATPLNINDETFEEVQGDSIEGRLMVPSPPLLT